MTGQHADCLALPGMLFSLAPLTATEDKSVIVRGGMRTGNMSLQEFHDFANLTHAILWRGVAAVRRARSSIADSRRVCEETRELLAALQHRRRRPRRPPPLRGTLTG